MAAFNTAYSVPSIMSYNSEEAVMLYLTKLPHHLSLLFLLHCRDFLANWFFMAPKSRIFLFCSAHLSTFYGRMPLAPYWFAGAVIIQTMLVARRLLHRSQLSLKCLSWLHCEVWLKSPWQVELKTCRADLHVQTQSCFHHQRMQKCWA